VRAIKEDKTKVKVPFKSAENLKPNKFTPSNKSPAQKVKEQPKKELKAKTHKRTVSLYDLNKEALEKE